MRKDVRSFLTNRFATTTCKLTLTCVFFLGSGAVYAEEEDGYGIAMFACMFALAFGELGGVQVGVAAEAPIPGEDDFTGSQPVAGGTQGNFDPDQDITTRVVRFTQSSDQFAGTPAEKFFAVIDGSPGQPDFAAVAGNNTDIMIDDWNVKEFFFEFVDTNGIMVASEDQFPRDFSGATDSQCSMTLENTDTQEQIQRTGIVTFPGFATAEKLIQNLQRGDTSGLEDIVAAANEEPEDEFVANLTGGDQAFIINDTLKLFGNLTINGAGEFKREQGGEPLVSIGPGGSFGLTNTSDVRTQVTAVSDSAPAFHITAGGTLKAENITVDGVVIAGAAPAIVGEPGSNLDIRNATFSSNSGQEAGAILANEPFTFELINSVFRQNTATNSEGACAVKIVGGRLVVVSGSIFEADDCGLSQFVIEDNEVTVTNSEFRNLEPVSHPGFHSTNARANLQLSVFRLDDSEQQQQAGSVIKSSADPGPKLQDVCEADGEPGFVSLGYNISTDDSCGLDHETDLPDTDPMFELADMNGISTPAPGSPAIDIGPDELVSQDGDGALLLPCPWVDIYGLGSPQDGDNDGNFECDAGPVEVQGEGEIVPGHSRAYFNSSRSGEGQYVQMLSESSALIYTFSYRPDGSGPSWLIATADIVGNSLVGVNVLRPVGTSFGEDFAAGDIELTEWGGMSMVFPTCTSVDQPGNAAYSGSPDLGYEPLLTALQSLTDIAGCGDTMPHPNAHLSGSYFDAARSGEGIIVEWLPDGRVLVMMFTFDTNGNQMWILGTGDADGDSVTMEAIYPTSFTSWGSGFDPSAPVFETWGTFMLTWTDCDNVIFEYSSELNGYGSATRDYTRLTSLHGLGCPD